MPKVGMEPHRRAAIINSALKCISLYGVDGFTLDQVAVGAGCSKGVASYYFKNKKTLVIESFKAFLAYYGEKIMNDLTPGMTSEAMMELTLFHSLPPETIDDEKEINVSTLDGADKMHIPLDDKARLFVQFFSRAAIDPDFQKVIAEAYQKDISGIAEIFEYGLASGQMTTKNAMHAGYGFLAMVVGLSFFRVTGIGMPNNEDNRIVCVDYLNHLMGKTSH